MEFRELDNTNLKKVMKLNVVRCSTNDDKDYDVVIPENYFEGDYEVGYESINFHHYEIPIDSRLKKLIKGLEGSSSLKAVSDYFYNDCLFKSKKEKVDYFIDEVKYLADKADNPFNYRIEYLENYLRTVLLIDSIYGEDNSSISKDKRTFVNNKFSRVRDYVCNHKSEDFSKVCSYYYEDDIFIIYFKTQGDNVIIKYERFNADAPKELVKKEELKFDNPNDFRIRFKFPRDDDMRELYPYNNPISLIPEIEFDYEDENSNLKFSNSFRR